MLNRPTNGFAYMRDDALVQLSTLIVSQMTDNQNFPTPNPALSVVNTALTAYALAITEAASGDRVKIQIRKQKKADLVNLLHRLADYTLYAAQNDRAKLLSSGFPLNKLREPKPAVTAAANLTVDNGQNAGELLAAWDTVPGAIAYQVQYTPDPVAPNTVWQTAPTSRRSLVLRNLESNKRYLVRVGVLGKDDRLVVGDAVSRVVQ